MSINYRYYIHSSGAISVVRRCLTATDKARESRERRGEYRYIMKRSKIIDASCALWRQKSGKVLYFWAVTIPEYVNEVTLARAWERYLTILRNEYKFKYVWVKERQKNGNIHYHILSDKRIVISDYQRHWEACLRKYCNVTTVTHNSVRLGDNPVVYSVNSVRFYLSKYASKSVRDCVVWGRKCYGYSNCLILKVEVDEADVRYLCQLCEFKLIFSGDFYFYYVLKRGSMRLIYEFFP